MKLSMTMKHLLASAFTALVTFTSPAVGEASFTPILPPSYPLAVRNPYLSGKYHLNINLRPR